MEAIVLVHIHTMRAGHQVTALGWEGGNEPERHHGGESSTEAEGGDSEGTSQVSWGLFLGDSTVPFAKMGIPK